MGYVQKMRLRVLNNENSQLIAVVINSYKKYEEATLADPFYGKILGFIELNLRKHGYYMMLYSTDDVNEIFRIVATWNVDGVIALTFPMRDCEKIWHMIHKPVVSIDAFNDLEGSSTITNVGLDDSKGSYLMTKYLLKCGYKNISGYDDIAFARLTVPKLTTIHQDIQKKAELAVEELSLPYSLLI